MAGVPRFPLEGANVGEIIRPGNPGTINVSMGLIGTADERIRVRAQDGEEVTLSCKTSRLVGTLKDLMDFATSEDGIYSIPAIRASTLQMVCKLNDPAFTWPSMDQLYEHSLVQLIKLIEDALYLDAPMALRQIQRAVASRLNGKRALEIRALLGEGTDFGSAEEHAATLAESAFVPESSEAPRQPASSMEPPALLRQPTLSGVRSQLNDVVRAMSPEQLTGLQAPASRLVATELPALLQSLEDVAMVLQKYEKDNVVQENVTRGATATADAQEAALGLVDVATLVELKGVNRCWRALARRVLCSRLCRRDGQPVPTQLDEITDLDVEQIIEAGRPWEVFIAGRMLPGLARIHGYGFEVDVTKARAAEVSMGVHAAMIFDQQADQMFDQQAAIMGHLLAFRPAWEVPSPDRVGGVATENRAVAQAALKRALDSCISGDGEPPLKLTTATAAVACMHWEVICGVPVQAMLQESVTMLDLSRKGLGLEGAMLLGYLVASTASLTSLIVAESALCGLRKGPEQYDVYERTGWTLGRYVNNLHGTYSAEGIAAIANALCVSRSLTCVDLSRNIFGPEGARSIAHAICVNSSITSLNLACNRIGSEGASALGEALKVNSSLLRVDVRWNIIAGDGAAQLSAAVLSNLTLEMFNHIPIKEMRADFFTELDLYCKGIGVEGGMVVAGLIPVMGSLTMTNLLRNELDAESAKMLTEVATQKGISLCGIRRGQTGGMSSSTTTRTHGQNADERLEPHDAILWMSDLSQAVVTGSLTSLTLAGNELGDKGIVVVAGLIPAMASLTSLCLRYNHLGPEGASALTPALAANSSLTSLDLDANQLCGVDSDGKGFYTAEGITAIADALRVNSVLTKLSLASTMLGEDGTKSICEALQDSKTLKELDLSGSWKYGYNNIGYAAGAKHVADMLGSNRSLTKLSLARIGPFGIGLGEEGTKLICDALKFNITLKELDLSGDADDSNNIGGTAGAKHVVNMLLVNRSLTECNLSWLGFGLEDVEGEALIRNALQGTAFECAAIRIGSAVYIDKIVPRPLRAVVQTYDAPRGILHVQLGSQWQGHNDFNGEPYEGRSILISEREVCRSCVSSGASFVVFR